MQHPSAPFRPRRLALLAACGLLAVASVLLLLTDGPARSAKGTRAPRLWRLSSPTQTLWMKTPFSTVKLFHKDGYRCMGFSDGKEVLTQSCMHPQRPLAYGAEYIGMMFAVSAALPRRPRRVLVLGVGGATLPKLLQRFYPQAIVDAVDIDPGVIQIARYYFGLRTGPKMRTYAQDARAFVRAQAGKTRYDLIYIDCFDDTYIPAHLLNLSFFKEVAKILAPKGIMAANVFMTHKQYPQTLATWKAVFPRLWRLKGVKSGNTIVIGGPNLDWRSQAQLRKRARAWERRHKGALALAKEFQKAKPVRLSAKIRTIKSAKPFRATTSPTASRCNTSKGSCCGLTGTWRGHVQLRHASGTLRHVLRGQIFVQDRACYGRFTITGAAKQRGRTAQDFRVRFLGASQTTRPHIRARIHMDGILARGRRARLHHFRMRSSPQGLRGQVWRKGAPRGSVHLRRVRHQRSAAPKRALPRTPATRKAK